MQDINGQVYFIAKVPAKVRKEFDDFCTKKNMQEIKEGKLKTSKKAFIVDAIKQYISNN